MAINNCTPPRIFGPPAQTLFLGASVKDFTLTAGWNEQASNLTVTLVEDTRCAGNKVYWDENLNRQSGVMVDPGFVEPEPGSAVYFRMEEDPRAEDASDRKGIEYAGLVQSWTKAYNNQGNPVYTVQITDPRIVLQNTQVVVNNYAGATAGVPNLLNAYAFTEGQVRGSDICGSSPVGRFGGVTFDGTPGFPANARGMAWNDIKCAIHTLTSCPNAAIAQGFYGSYLNGSRIRYIEGADLSYGTIRTNDGYMVDLSDVPFAPTDYRISGPTLSVMELVTQVCQDAGCDFYVEYQPTKNGSTIYNIIKIRTAQRQNQPAMGALQTFIDQQSGLAEEAQGGIISWTEGEEVRNEDTSIYLIGGEQRFDLEITNLGMLPYWGLDNDGALIQAQVAAGEYQVRLDVRRLNGSLYTSFATSFIWVSESELRAALGDFDAWKHVTLAKGLGVATHFASIKQQKFLSAEKIQQAADGEIPAHGLVIPSIDATSNDNDPNNSSAKDVTKIYDFIKSFADEFYGKQFIAATDFICYVPDTDANKFKYSHEPSTEGCWIDGGTVIGLDVTSSAADFFTSNDGRFQPIIRYPYSAGFTYAGAGGSLVADPSNLGDNNYITNGTYIWQKADIDTRIIFGNPQAPGNGVPGMLLKVGAPVYNTTSRDTGGTDGVDQNQAGADFLAEETGGAGLTVPSWRDRSAFSLSMVGNAISPDAAMVPIWSHVDVYGPWGVAGPPGQTRVVNDDSFVPWEFGSASLMAAAAIDKVSNATTSMLKGERGTVQIAGFLGRPLGSELLAAPGNNDYIESRTPSFTQCADAVAYTYLSKPGWQGSNGPNITNINVGVGANGFTTEYQFSTYTPRFGRFDKDNADRLKQIGQQRLAQARNARAKQALAQQITAAVSNIRQRINDQLGKSARAPKSASHMFIGGFAGERNESFTLNAKEASLTFPNDAKYAESAMMSIDGLIRPVSKAGDGSLPRFINYTESTCSGNVNQSIAPDGPKYTYSGIKVSQDFLDPLSNPGEGVSVRDTAASGHDIEILGRNTSAPPSGWAIAEGEEEGSTGYADDYRFFAMRGPLVLQGWGYDTAGKPVPNASDSDANAEAGTFTTSSLQDEFLAGFLKKPKTWPVAPVDLRLDRKRGVWTVPPPPRNLHVNATGSCLSEDTIASVTNAQTTYDDTGGTVDNDIKITASPWDVELPKAVGKIPVYYDTSDCKYYPFPVNRLDITSSGVGGTGTAGYFDRFSDVKHIVFASGFSGISLTSGCDNTVYIHAIQQTGDTVENLAQYKQNTSPFWPDSISSSCSGNLPTTVDSCSGTDCLTIGKGLTLSVDGTGLLLDSWQFIEDIGYTCSAGSFTSGSLGCNPYNSLQIGSGLVVSEETADSVYTINSLIDVYGRTVTTCVNPTGPTARVANAAEHGLDFVGWLSTSVDSSTCRVRVSGVEPTIRVLNTPTCPASESPTDLGLANSIVFTTGLKATIDGCRATVTSTFGVEGFDNNCDQNVSTYTPITGISFSTGLNVWDDGCGRVKVASTLFISGKPVCNELSPGVGRNPYYYSNTPTGLVFGKGIKIVEADSPVFCQPNISVSLHVSGTNSYTNLKEKISDWDALIFTGNLSVDSTDACTVTISGDNRISFSGEENCGQSKVADFLQRRLIASTGLMIEQQAEGAVISSNFIANGYSDACIQTPSEEITDVRIRELSFGTGLIFTTGLCSATIDSPYFIKTTGDCRGTSYERTTTGLRIGAGLRVDGIGCNPLISANLFASGAAGAGGAIQKIQGWNNIQVTGDIYVEQIDDCTIQISGAAGGGEVAVTGSTNACVWSADTTNNSIEGIIFGTGLSTTVSGNSIHVNSRFGVTGTPDGCRGEYYSDRNITGIEVGRGLALSSNASCRPILRSNIYASGASSAGGAVDVKTAAWDAIQFTGNLTTTYSASDCKIVVSGVNTSSIAVTGSDDPCTVNQNTKNNDIAGFLFGTGLKVTDDGGLINVNSRFLVGGVKDGCRGTEVNAANATGINVGKGLLLTNSAGCSSLISTNLAISGASTLGGAVNKYTGWDAIQVTGSLVVEQVDSCTVRISGVDNSFPITVTGSTNPCTLGADTVVQETAGIVFSTGLKTITSADGVSVSAPFSVSGDGSACRGEYFAQSTTTGIVVGKGLKASADASCATLIDFNVAASGGPGDTKLQGWDGIQFTGNLTVSSIDGCTIRVSGSQSPIAITGSTNPCTPANDTVVNSADGIIFGTGLKTTQDADGGVHVNSKFYVSGDGGVCGGTYAAGAHTTGIVVGAGLKATNSSCSSNIELNFLASQGAACGAGAGSESAISKMVYGTGLTFTANGCTGTLLSNITANGSTYANPCDVASRSDTFANKRFQNIEFAGYLNSAIDGCDVVVSGGKSPINMGPDGSLFEAVGLVAGKRIDITSSGTCTGVISATSISITGSSDECTDARDVTASDIDGIIFGTGLRATSTDGGLIIDSPFEVEGLGVCSSAAYAASQSSKLQFGKGLLVTENTACEQLVQSNIKVLATGTSGTFDNIEFVGNLSTTWDGCGVTVSGTSSALISVSGDNSCGKSYYNNGSVTGLMFSTGLAVSEDGAGNAVISSTIRAQGGAITDECAVPPTRDAAFDSLFTNLIFTGYLSSSTDGCDVTIEGKRSPITISKSGTFCGTEVSESGNITNLSIGSGLALTGVAGCSATLLTDMKISQAETCNRSAVPEALFTNLEFKTGLAITQKAGSSCTWEISNVFNVEGNNDCGYGGGTTSVNGVEKIVFSSGLAIQDDGNCQVTVTSKKLVGGGGSNGCLGGTASPVPFDTLLFSGLSVSTDGCTTTIGGPTLTVAHNGSCNSSTLATSCFNNLIFSTGIKIEGSNGTYEVAGGIEFLKTGCGAPSNINNYSNFANVIVGEGLNARDVGLCTVKIDAGLSGIRSGSQIRGQQVNCGTPSAVPPGTCSTDCLAAGYEGPFDDRSIPLAVNGLYSGPGIGFASCEGDCDLIIFQNSAVSGLNNTCGGELGLQVYSTYFSNAFTINGNKGVDLTTNTPVDGATFSHGVNVFMNEGGGAWNCSLVTGVEFEQTKVDGYVTNVTVTPLFGVLGGSSTCDPGDATSKDLPGESKKFWVTTIPC